VSKAQLDDFGYFSISAERNEGMNATTWATQQFVTWHLLSVGSSPSEKSFDGLDKMLLLSWVKRKLSASDDQPFVLHYWDLRPPTSLLMKRIIRLGEPPDCPQTNSKKELLIGTM
jgi:hypothetical protein